MFVTCSDDRTVKLWDLRSHSHYRKPIQTLNDAKDSVISMCQVHSDANCELLCGGLDGNLRRYDIRFGCVTIDQITSGSAPVSHISISGDGQCVLCSTLEDKIVLLEKDSGEELQVYEGFSSGEYRLWSSLDPNDAYVVSGSADGKLVVWELVEGQIECKLIPEDSVSSGTSKKSMIMSLAFRDEDMLCCGSSDGIIRVFTKT